MSDRVADRRRHNFYIVDNAILDHYTPKGIGVYGLGVYNVLARMANPSGQSWPAQQTMADRLGISLSQVKRELAKLEAAGLVQVVERDGTSNAYILRPVGPDSEAGGPDPVVGTADRGQAATAGTVWDQTVGAVIAAGDHQSRLSALHRLHVVAFGAKASPAQLQGLITKAGSPEQLARVIARLAVSVEPPVQNPYGLILKALKQPQAAGKRAKDIQDAGNTGDSYGLDWGADG